MRKKKAFPLTPPSHTLLSCLAVLIDRICKALCCFLLRRYARPSFVLSNATAPCTNPSPFPVHVMLSLSKHLYVLYHYPSPLPSLRGAQQRGNFPMTFLTFSTLLKKNYTITSLCGGFLPPLRETVLLIRKKFSTLELRHTYSSCTFLPVS